MTVADLRAKLSIANPDSEVVAEFVDGDNLFIGDLRLMKIEGNRVTLYGTWKPEPTAMQRLKEMGTK